MQPAGRHRTIVFRLLRQLAALVLLAALAAGAAYQLHPHRPLYQVTRFPEIDAADLAPTEPVLWIDARPSIAYTAGHIPGALSLSEDAWEASLPTFVEAWHPGQKIIVYCDSSQCGASGAVAQRLVREFGVTRIYVLKGGWKSWQKR